jgi:ABC-type transport system involved in multi-copper enzyme maturation permease subunit
MNRPAQQSAATSSTPARQSRIRALWSLTWFSALQLLRHQRVALMLILMAVPLVVAVVLRSIGRLNEPELFYWNMTIYVFQMAVIPLLSMLFFSSLIAGEAGEGMLVYLFTRRLSRPGVLAGKFVGTFVTVTALALAAHAAFFFVTFTASINVAPQWDVLWMTLVTNTLAIAVFACVFTLIGLVARKPMGVGIMYLLIFEIALTFMQLNIQRFSLLYYIRSILWNAHQGRVLLADVLVVEEVEPTLPALIILGAVAAATLVASLVLVRMKEFTRLDAGEA